MSPCPPIEGGPSAVIRAFIRTIGAAYLRQAEVRTRL